MYIFYDFETSSRHLLGQILSYAFVVTDTKYNVVKHCQGIVKLNRTQCPEMGAILTNKLDVSVLQEQGDSEYDTAHNIRDFIQSVIQEFGACTLVGFNSNSFDLSFLRTLLIRYGLNPYFMGKVKNLDILHWLQYLAFYQSEAFPWVLTQSESNSYYSFRLEDIAQATGLLSDAQSHDALDDVMLTINVVKHFELEFSTSLTQFQAVHIPWDKDNQDISQCFKLRRRHFVAPGEQPEHFEYDAVMSLSKQEKALLFVDLKKVQALPESASDADKCRCIRYVNMNKAFFVCDPFTESDKQQFADTQHAVLNDRFFQALMAEPALYFEKIKKDWDIDYQIHELGFKRIDRLFVLVQKLIHEPSSYTHLLTELLANRKEEKDNYLIQLFNRVYLNYHPQPKREHLQRYLVPRYIDGSLYNSSGCERVIDQDIAALRVAMNDEAHEKDLGIMQGLMQYYQAFKEQFFVEHV